MTEQIVADQLAADITSFLIDHAKVGGQYVPNDPFTAEHRYNGPDPFELEATAQSLRDGVPLSRLPFSEWGSGCYRPIQSTKACTLHDSLIVRCQPFVGKNK